MSSNWDDRERLSVGVFLATFKPIHDTTLSPASETDDVTECLQHNIGPSAHCLFWGAGSIQILFTYWVGLYWACKTDRTHYAEFSLLPHSLSQKIPLRFSDVFPKRLGIFSPKFIHLFHFPVYAGVQIFIKLSAILTKLGYAILSATTQFTP